MPEVVTDPFLLEQLGAPSAPSVSAPGKVTDPALLEQLAQAPSSIPSPKWSEVPSGMPRGALKSLGKYASDYAHAFTDPAGTLNALSGTILGGLQYAHLAPGESGKPYARAIAQDYIDTYGGLPQIKRTLRDDPLRPIGDLATLLSAGSLGAARFPATLGRAAAISKAIDPVTLASRAIKPVAGAATHALGLAGADVPTIMREYEVARVGNPAQRQLANAERSALPYVSPIPLSHGLGVYGLHYLGLPKEFTIPIGAAIGLSRQDRLMRAGAHRAGLLERNAPLPRSGGVFGRYSDTETPELGQPELSPPIRQSGGRIEDIGDDPLHIAHRVLDAYRSRSGGRIASKRTKSETHYREHGGSRRCELCAMFREPAQCTRVRGHISPRATCDLFELKARNRQEGGGVSGDEESLRSEALTAARSPTPVSFGRLAGESPRFSLPEDPITAAERASERYGVHPRPSHLVSGLDAAIASALTRPIRMFSASESMRTSGRDDPWRYDPAPMVEQMRSMLGRVPFARPGAAGVAGGALTGRRLGPRDFDMLLSQQRSLESAAPRFVHNETIVAPALRHNRDVIHGVPGETHMDLRDRTGAGLDHESGYLTSNGRYATRREAENLALRSAQIGARRGSLGTEDLWSGVTPPEFPNDDWSIGAWLKKHTPRS